MAFSVINTFIVKVFGLRNVGKHAGTLPRQCYIDSRHAHITVPCVSLQARYAASLVS